MAHFENQNRPFGLSEHSQNKDSQYLLHNSIEKQ